jgi:V-type H+-transporting ATPase subunit G
VQCTHQLTCLGRQQHTTGNKQAEEEADKDAKAKIKQIKSAGEEKKDKVINDLLKAVFEVHPVPPSKA